MYYLNGSVGYSLYRETAANPFFVDKTALLTELLLLIGSDSKYICITRPRRFGKTVMANMISAFLSKGVDSSDMFGRLKIAKGSEYKEHLNRHNVIQIDFSAVNDNYKSYSDYIGSIQESLQEDLHAAYPEVAFGSKSTFVEDLKKIYAKTNERFVFVLDEWDAVFHMPFIKENDKLEYLLFLKGLLKDKAYVSLAYMTGILPISKYSGGSELNMFAEYNMALMERYSNYFGFTEKEVDMLYERYIRIEGNPKVTREGLGEWYDGYHTASGERLYNPRSVVLALQNNQLYNYWTNSGPYDEIFYYVRNNIADVRDDLVLMVMGERVPAKVWEYAATSTELDSKNQIYSAMVVYGLLTYEDGEVFIPNQELMGKFEELLQTKSSLGYVDFIFYPARPGDDGIILELKADHTPEEAIRQIKDKQYALRFKGKLGETPKYTGRILAGGIGYRKDTKEHACKIEILT